MGYCRTEGLRVRDISLIAQVLKAGYGDLLGPSNSNRLHEPNLRIPGRPPEQYRARRRSISMFLRRKLENERDDVSCSGPGGFLEKYWGAQVDSGSAELRFFSSIHRLPNHHGPPSPSDASVDCSLLKRFSHGSARSAVSSWRLTRRCAPGL